MTGYKEYFVYIATNYTNTVLYTGVTNNIYRRIDEHKERSTDGFTAKYKVSKLIYIASFVTAIEAITAEKKIKGWTRAKKIALIKSINPTWKDLLKE